MEKALDMARGLLAEFMEFLMHPVSKVTEIAPKENIKRGFIKGLIIAFVLSVTSVLATIRTIYIYNDTSIKDIDDNIEQLNPIVSIIRTFGIYILVILTVAMVLFAISKIVKNQKALPYTLSMTVNSATVLTVAAVIALALSFWTPLSVLVITLASLHSGLTLLVSYISSLNASTDKLVLAAVIVLTVIGIILSIINMIKYDKKLSEYSNEKFGSKTQYGDVQYFKYNKS